MKPPSAPTVAMLQTPPGAGGVAVIVLVGADARRIVADVFTPRTSEPIASIDPHRLRLGELRDGDERIDEAIVAVRPCGSGGDVAEISIHGGPRVTQRALQRLAAAGAAVTVDSADMPPEAMFGPLSAPGLDNPAIGREMLAALPAVQTRFVMGVLTGQWSGGISRLANEVLAEIKAGRVEAGEMERLAAELRAAADRLTTMQRLLNPPEVVLAGPPNAGKSTLTNSLLGRQACIVTHVAGTTRDWVREMADINGRGCWLTDTAGLWAPDDPLDHEAVQRAWHRVDGADLVCAVFDAAAAPAENEPHWRRLLAEPNVLVVANKSDLAPAPAVAVAASASFLTDLRAAIVDRLALGDISGDLPAAFTDRQSQHLLAAADALGEVKTATTELKRLLGRQ